MTKIIMMTNRLLGEVSQIINYGIIFFIMLIALVFRVVEYIQFFILLFICGVVWTFAKVEDLRITLFGLLFANIIINDMLKTHK